MMRSHTFWLWTAAVVQLLTAVVHALGFLNEPSPQNESERQLFDLVNNYQFDMGLGFQPTMGDLTLALSSCFSMLYLFGGMVNIYLLRKKAAPEMIKGITGISLIVFGASFLIMLIYTFLPPIVLTATVFVVLCFAYATNKA